jgi:hypothetical protein
MLENGCRDAPKRLGVAPLKEPQFGRNPEEKAEKREPGSNPNPKHNLKQRLNLAGIDMMARIHGCKTSPTPNSDANR